MAPSANTVAVIALEPEVQVGMSAEPKAFHSRRTCSLALQADPRALLLGSRRS